MGISFNKKEVEKKKALKKRDKQKRKEERRANGTSSFDDMIAYVDENGNICDTPPEVSAHEEIDPSTIQVSTPRREESEEEQPTGRVDFFDERKGFGFIIADNIDRVFFHISNAPDDIKIGDKVTFDLTHDERGMCALNVQHLSPSAE
jgi:cold shock CspA family protein